MTCKCLLNIQAGAEGRKKHSGNFDILILHLHIKSIIGQLSVIKVRFLTQRFDSCYFESFSSDHKCKIVLSC